MITFDSFPELYKKLFHFILLILAILLIGTIGYLIIQPEFSFLDAMYFTTITLSTVGFEEVNPLGETAKIFTIFLIFIGVSALGYGISSITSIVVEGQIKNTFRDRKMEKKIKNLSHHIILCGHGKLGTHAASELEKWNKPFVVIECNKEIAERLKFQNKFCIWGNATEDEVLIKAGIYRARGLIAALSHDTENLFVALTARRLNKDVTIVSRAESDSSEVKLLSAGADKVLFPMQIAGSRIASMLIHPEVINFLDVVVDSSDMNLTLQEFHIPKGSFMDGVPIRDCKMAHELRIIGLKEPGKEIKVNPGANTLLENGQVMIILGEKAKLDELQDKISTSN